MSVRACRSMSERGLGEIKWVTIFGAWSVIWGKRSTVYESKSRVMAETLLRYSVFNITLSNLNRFASFFFEHKSNIIPDISVSLEYFVSVGKQSYIDMRSVGGQLHIINQFSAQCDHRIILDISVSSEYSVSPREQVHFHMEDTCTSKSKFGALQAILHCFA